MIRPSTLWLEAIISAFDKLNASKAGDKPVQPVDVSEMCTPLSGFNIARKCAAASGVIDIVRSMT
jgi:hypothetical protein